MQLDEHCIELMGFPDRTCSGLVRQLKVVQSPRQESSRRYGEPLPAQQAVRATTCLDRSEYEGNLFGVRLGRNEMAKDCVIVATRQAQT